MHARPRRALLGLALLAAAVTPARAAAATAATRVRRLTNLVNSYPAPSPDGTRVVFQSNRTGRWEIFVMAADGSDVRQLTDEPGDNVTPVWSPDGRWIAFAASPEGTPTSS